MNTYKIICETNWYQARRNAMFERGKNSVVLFDSLTLSQAQKELLKLYNDKFEDERPYAPNWGIAVIQSRRFVDGASPTFQDGTRTFDFDGYYFSIVEEDEDLTNELQ